MSLQLVGKRLRSYDEWMISLSSLGIYRLEVRKLLTGSSLGMYSRMWVTERYKNEGEHGVEDVEGKRKRKNKNFIGSRRIELARSRSPGRTMVAQLTSGRAPRVVFGGRKFSVFIVEGQMYHVVFTCRKNLFSAPYHWP